MRFLNLQLRAFGPFTGVTLDFSANPSAIQIVYGPNEAGKSSALRAVNALLFGIPERTGDAFVHDNQALRIGAAIERSSGDQLTFLRRKGRKDTLLDSNENALPDDTLRPFLQGINENLFASAFGLNHEILVKGGLDLAAGKGEIGEIHHGVRSFRDHRSFTSRILGAPECFQPADTFGRFCFTAAIHGLGMKSGETGHSTEIRGSRMPCKRRSQSPERGSADCRDHHHRSNVWHSRNGVKNRFDAEQASPIPCRLAAIRFRDSRWRWR